MTACLGPYNISSSNLIDSGNSVFIDHNKTRLVAIIQECNKPETKPTPNSVILHQVNLCNDCIVRWYECPDVLGRKYSFEISGCDIKITNFENGFLYQSPCDASEFGSQSFCFGKVYLKSGVQSGIACESAFEFDGHSFVISGISSSDNDMFECINCMDFMAFGSDPTTTDLQPDAPSEAIDAADSIEDGEDDDSETTLISSENRTNWPIPSEWTTQSTDVFCNNATSLIKDDCDSYSNPSIAMLMSGQSVIAYTDRDEDGKTKIALAIFGSSVENKVIYSRKLSKGVLLNEPNPKFEIFEELSIDTNSDVPISPVFIGFLTGPLKGGQVFQITKITRTTDGNSRPKNTITFNNSGVTTVFSDSNHASGISWFIISGTESNPTDISLLDLPVHKKNNIQVPVDQPSIAVAENSLMSGEDQHIYITYQAFEDKIWKTYLTQIRLSEKQSANPKYLSPYLFSAPVEVSAFIIQDGIEELKYKVKKLNSISNPNEIKVLFEVFTTSDKNVFDCDLSTSGYITDLGFVISDANGLSPNLAWVECSYSIPCGGSSLPDWSLGTEYTGGVLPSASELGWSGSPSCISGIKAYPDTVDWCYNKASCTQFSLIDDPYCPDAYDDIINLEYKPEDLYVLNDNGNFITRVKYHMSASARGLSEASSADIMFVIDYSGSMGPFINSTRNAVPLLAQLLQRQGIDAKFGLTVYGSSNNPLNTPIPTDYYVCGTGGDRMFNGLSPSVGACQCSEGGSLPDEAIGGFTDNVALLTKALCCWGVTGGKEPHWAAIQFAAGLEVDGDVSPFVWRENARKFIILITDEPPNESNNAPPSGSCLGFSNSKSSALSALIDQDIVFIPIVDPAYSSSFSDIPEQTGWNGDSFFDINSNSYDNIFAEISRSIETITSGLRILERDSLGYNPTFIKNAEILVTYIGDLSDLWTFNKSNFVFSDVAPTLDGNLKGLSNFPYSIYQNKIYNIDSVHVIGNINNWVYYKSTGQLRFDYPNLGFLPSSRTGPEFLVNGTRSTIKINNRNEIFVAYESLDNGYNQIDIIGTGDFCQNSITGPKSTRITKIVSSSDFVFKHNITLESEGVNQLCDFVIDNSDVIHITWQSNRDNYWEIYYASSQNIFDPIRVTKSKSRSGFPKIDIDSTGLVFIVYHDNRFGPYDIMLSYKNEKRIIPLLEQDAYVASQKSEYRHYTNTLPILLRNDSTTTPLPGEFVFSKISSNDGNGSENYIFLVDDNGSPNRGGIVDYEIVAMAGNIKGFLYGITSDAKLLELDVPEFEDPYLDVEVNEIVEIGNIDFAIPVSGIIRIEDNFDRNDNTSFPTSNWTQQTNSIGFLQNANAFICSGRVTLCGSCPPLNYCSSPFVGHYINNTRIVQDDRNLSIKTRVRWFNPSGDSNIDGATFTVYLRGQPSATDSPSPSYQVILRHSSNSSGVFRTNVLVGRNSTPTNLLTIGSFEFNSNENVWMNRWADLQIDCYDVGSNVKFDIYIDGVLRFTTTDSGGSLGGPIVSHSSGAFSYGFGCSAIETDDTLSTGIYSFALVDSYSVEVLSQLLNSTTVLDAAHDNSEILWCLVSNINSEGSTEQRAIQINKSTAQTSFSGITRDEITKSSGGLAIDHNGKFYIISYFGGKSELKSSSYPKISNSEAVFDFSIINDDMDVNFTALTIDHENKLYGLDENNGIYAINTNSGSTSFLYDLTTGPYEDPYLGPNPISTVSGFSTLYTGLVNKTSESGFFHVLLEFYDNLDKNGIPFLSIDSRTNLEAFIVDEREDSYIEDAYFSGAKGVFLEENESSYIFFDASHFTPNSNALAYPYRLDTNQTYFPKAYLIDELGSILQGNLQQEVSYSCNKCSTFSNNLFDQHACSFSFTAENTSKTKTYKFMVDFFADRERKHLIQRYILTSDSASLGLFEINNKPASGDSNINSNGLTIGSDKKPFIQIYPSLDVNTGIICGVTYYVSAYICDNGDCDTPNANPIGLNINHNSTFICECSSNIFDNRVENIAKTSRWISSSNGYSDTRVTDTPNDSLRPDISTRTTDAAVIVFEEDNKIKAATFNKIDETNIFGSGTRSWFDYDTGVVGKDVTMDIDLYDRVSMSYSILDETYGRGISKTELPTSNIENKVCDFINENIQPNLNETCNINDITSNVLTSDPFISQQVVKKITIKNSDYHTYNASGTVTAVIGDCNVVLQIWGTPESIAIRFKNENQAEFSDWCPFEPELSNFYMEKNWVMSGGSGSKEICVQVMTYNGVTTQFCMPVIADYQKTFYQIRLYADSAHSMPLSLYDGLFVATTKDNNGLSLENKEIWIEIIPSRKLDVNAINFDVIQQGSEDQINLVANKRVSSEGVIVYKGKFTVILEDKVLNIDGLAQIRPKFPTVCDNDDPFSDSSNNFIKDKFNLNANPLEVLTNQPDGIGNNRQSITGRVGVDIVVRPEEDQFLIFGDPDFYTNIKTPNLNNLPSSSDFGVIEGSTNGENSGTNTGGTNTGGTNTNTGGTGGSASNNAGSVPGGSNNTGPIIEGEEELLAGG